MWRVSKLRQHGLLAAHGMARIMKKIHQGAAPSLLAQIFCLPLAL